MAELNPWEYMYAGTRTALHIFVLQVTFQTFYFCSTAITLTISFTTYYTEALSNLVWPVSAYSFPPWEAELKYSKVTLYKIQWDVGLLSPIINTQSMSLYK